MYLSEQYDLEPCLVQDGHEDLIEGGEVFPFFRTMKLSITFYLRSMMIIAFILTILVIAVSYSGIGIWIQS